jgi:hypothetical protein
MVGTARTAIARDSRSQSEGRLHAGQDAGAFLSKKLNDRDYSDGNGVPLSGRFHLEIALRHNLRELLAERGPYGNIDPNRTPDNYILRGPGMSFDAMAAADKIVSSADTGGKRLRKDAVWGIELIFTALPKAGDDFRSYFEDCTRWAEQEFKVPVLSSIVHLDQGAPHCHVLLVPLFKGKMNGGKVYGNKATMVARLSSFYEVVGKRYGLNRPHPKEKLPAAERKGLLQRCADYLSEGRRLTANQIDTILKAFHENPLPLAKCFNVEVRGKRVERGTFIDIMTSAA